MADTDLLGQFKKKMSVKCLLILSVKLFLFLWIFLFFMDKAELIRLAEMAGVMHDRPQLFYP